MINEKGCHRQRTLLSVCYLRRFFFFSMMLFVCLFVCFSFHSRSDPSIDIKIHSTNSNNTLFHKATRSSAVLLLAGNGATNENALNDNGESPLSMSLNGWRTDSLIALLTLNVDTTRVEASGVCVCVCVAQLDKSCFC